ncbi:MAG: hypothetical protein ABH954_04105 [Candidatus Omnitrophota bacterium]
MKIIAQGKAKTNKKQNRKEVIKMKKMMIMLVLISLMIGISNAYALVDEDSRNLVIAEQEYKGAQNRLLNTGELMVNYDFEFLKGGLK